MEPFVIYDQQGKAPGEALLIGHVLMCRDEIKKLDPWVPFPQQACCFCFGRSKMPLPVGALLTLWAEWLPSTGTCPGCGGVVHGYGFGGMLHSAGVIGVCLRCHARCSRQLGGLPAIAAQLRQALAGTPYEPSGARFGGTYGAPRRPLVELLRRLGVTDLPGYQWTADLPRQEVAIELEIDQVVGMKAGKVSTARLLFGPAPGGPAPTGTASGDEQEDETGAGGGASGVPGIDACDPKGGVQ